MGGEIEFLDLCCGGQAPLCIALSYWTVIVKPFDAAPLDPFCAVTV